MREPVLFEHRQIDSGDLGSLVPVDKFPFDIRRIFYVYGVKHGGRRGNHAHKLTDQCVVAVNGKCNVRCDNGQRITDFMLTSPQQMLYIPSGVWADQIYDHDTVLMVLCNTHYDRSEYIEVYDDFLSWVRNL